MTDAHECLYSLTPRLSHQRPGNEAMYMCGHLPTCGNNYLILATHNIVHSWLLNCLFVMTDLVARAICMISLPLI